MSFACLALINFWKHPALFKVLSYYYFPPLDYCCIVGVYMGWVLIRMKSIADSYEARNSCKKQQRKQSLTSLARVCELYQLMNIYYTVNEYIQYKIIAQEIYTAA